MSATPVAVGRLLAPSFLPTRAFARIYAAPADSDTPDVITAVAHARRMVQRETSRRDDHVKPDSIMPASPARAS